MNQNMHRNLFQSQILNFITILAFFYRLVPIFTIKQFRNPSFHAPLLKPVHAFRNRNLKPGTLSFRSALDNSKAGYFENFAYQKEP